MIIICSLIIASIITIIIFINWYADRQTNKLVLQWGERSEKCKIDRYEKSSYEHLGIWEIKDRLNNTGPIVRVYSLPDDVAEEIIDYCLKILEEGEMK